MNVNQQATDCAAAVEKTRRELDKLLQIQELLTAELPTAQRAYDTAVKKLQAATKPDRSASRKRELDLLKQRLGEAQNV